LSEVFGSGTVTAGLADPGLEPELSTAPVPACHPYGNTGPTNPE